jgi:glycosidase
MESTSEQLTWWQHGVIYQIYPRSFQDSNGDGVGDLPGILSRLDYLQWLGVNAVWLSPIYPSPMADFGYDIRDYENIDPVFGTLGDFDRLVQEVHRRALKLILDFVPNHTSDRHPWFQESRRSTGSQRRNWYIWRPPGSGGGPPNNWLGEFGGPAWTLDPQTGQYYYHAYLLLNLYRMLLRLRRDEPALATGEYRENSVGPHALSYERIAGSQRVLVALNFGAEPCNLPVSPGVHLSVLVSTDPRGPLASTASEKLHLRGAEGIIARLV